MDQRETAAMCSQTDGQWTLSLSIYDVLLPFNHHSLSPFCSQPNPDNFFYLLTNPPPSNSVYHISGLNNARLLSLANNNDQSLTSGPLISYRLHVTHSTIDQSEGIQPTKTAPTLFTDINLTADIKFHLLSKYITSDKSSSLNRPVRGKATGPHVTTNTSARRRPFSFVYFIFPCPPHLPHHCHRPFFFPFSALVSHSLLSRYTPISLSFFKLLSLALPHTSTTSPLHLHFIKYSSDL
ncbi:unnamed protein product [Acanthosepion pharaonis]|uniref:Uncharacterized protein n=1 Tax=Acanthosepion pharaonis TaxID=158019 RepID=A0A812B5J2_ACAPH|nr:unnamed protein product [Sepia pharaonis]